MTERAPGTERLEPGNVLAGKYKITRVLGKGGMGIVVEVEHLALRERFALKFLLPDVAAHPEAAERFMREARAAVRIKSEHVARVTDVAALDDGTPYMVMEYLHGGDLEERVTNEGPLPVREAVDYIIQACDAIAEAHGAGIVHRDLKPANLFLTKRSDGSDLVKVLDFGISKVRDDEHATLTQTNAHMGSVMYMSPDQLQESRNVDARADVYALGATLYRLLSAAYPYEGANIMQVCAAILNGERIALASRRPDLPAQLLATVEHALAPDRNARFASIAELASALAPEASPRSQAIVERIVRLAGSAGAAAPAADAVPQGTVRKVRTPRGAQANASGSTKLSSGGARDVAEPVSNADVTDLGQSLELPRPKRSRALTIAAVAVVAGAGAGATAMLFSSPEDGPAAAGSSAVSATVQGAQASAAPTVEAPAPQASAPQAPTVEPAASPSASASAEVAPPAAAHAAGAARPARPGARSPAPSARRTSAPSADGLPPGLFDDR